MNNAFTQGVRPGGLTTSTEVRILLCYILDNTNGSIKREQIENVLIGEEIANYFVLADGLSQICEQGLATEKDDNYEITASGRTVARTLADDVPRTIRESAVRGVIMAQQYAVKKAAHHCEIKQTSNGYLADCSIEDNSGTLFRMEMYMPDKLTAQSVEKNFINNADLVYKVVLSSLTNNNTLLENILKDLSKNRQ